MLLAVLQSCSNRPPAPIEDRTAGGTYRPEQRYTVLRGDTLYSIAFRYGLDFRRLAAANRIASPYTIYPGQTLQLREANPPPVQARAPAPSIKSSSAPPVATRSGKTPAPTPTSAATPKAAAPEPKPGLSPSTASPTAPVSTWLWPSGGRVIRGFDGNLHKGIDIGGARGAAVRATAGGRVVYAGSGIAGYGLLLILRHNDEYLSAYGHNDELLVNEGDTVRAGAVVARLGSSGTDSVKLHFEIRRSGRPIDPRSILPARR
ncbi:MAG: peptidoglycan DD-metalloendopeptidase family protein [Pseudomonadota bacterium]